ncbi:flagellar hook-basal body complex protein FliE [Allorhizobium sp. BGMRC 0089]|uniref:flagellar hook-basal body complex protein FliE n=1 Tax=Allorhizobium sonneratiae TaxID=2934936 RepID=UPI0020339C80|nr:flagellar hook-basal body complex protein FliE [Allorhizobium sonneratiae]MCM2291401.1 flagellar hook-basal body complex protein FliE [Allorhizobium sonneratiae]
MIDTISKIGSFAASGLTDETGGTSSTTASLGLGAGTFSTQGVTTQNSTPGTATGASFGEVMGSMMTDAMDSLKTAETNSIGGMLGKVSTREVVDSVMAADRTLQTAMAFRDKLVSAYLDITKMQI